MRKEIEGIYREYWAKEKPETAQVPASSPEELEATLNELLDTPQYLMVCLLGKPIRMPDGQLTYYTCFHVNHNLEGWSIIPQGGQIDYHIGQAPTEPISVAEASARLSQAGYTCERLETEWLEYIKRAIAEKEKVKPRW
jgi:hypothetical protein